MVDELDPVPVPIQAEHEGGGMLRTGHRHLDPGVVERRPAVLLDLAQGVLQVSDAEGQVDVSELVVVQGKLAGG